MRLSKWTPSLWALALNGVLATTKDPGTFNGFLPTESPSSTTVPTTSQTPESRVTFDNLMGAVGFGDQARILAANQQNQKLSWSYNDARITPQKLELWNYDRNMAFASKVWTSKDMTSTRGDMKIAMRADSLVELSVDGTTLTFVIDKTNPLWSDNFNQTTWAKLSWYDGVSQLGYSLSQTFVIVSDNTGPSIATGIDTLAKGQSPGISPESSSALTTDPTSSATGSAAPTSTNGFPSTSSNAALAPGAIAGIVVGAVVGLALIGGLVWFFCFRRRKQQNQSRDLGYGNDGGAAAMIADKEQPGVSESSPHSAYGDDGGRLHDRGSGPVDPSYMPYSDHAPHNHNSHNTSPATHAAAAADHTNIPPQTTGGTQSTSQEASTRYAHLVEEGMTPDEIRRLEEEERALDQAIDAAGHNRGGAH